MKKTTIFVSFGLAASLVGCSLFTAGESVSDPDMTRARATRASAEAAERAKSGESAPHPVPAHGAEAAKQAPAEPEVKETVTASHILISYEGARAASSTTKRSKAQAQKLAEEVAAKAHARNADFAELAKRYTEDPSGKSNGGKLGTFERGRLVKPFEDAAFALNPGQTSAVVETAFGFHIIYREK